MCDNSTAEIRENQSTILRYRTLLKQMASSQLDPTQSKQLAEILLLAFLELSFPSSSSYHSGRGSYCSDNILLYLFWALTYFGPFIILVSYGPTLVLSHFDLVNSSLLQYNCVLFLNIVKKVSFSLLHMLYIVF